MKLGDVHKWLTASPAEFERVARDVRGELRELMDAPSISKLFRVSPATVSRLPLRPRRGGGRGIKALYHVADVRQYLVSLNPSLKPWDVLPDSGPFMTPAELQTSLQRFGVARALDVPAIRVTPKTIRYREQDVGAALAGLDDGSELAALIHSDWGENK